MRSGELLLRSGSNLSIFVSLCNNQPPPVYAMTTNLNELQQTLYDFCETQSTVSSSATRTEVARTEKDLFFLLFHRSSLIYFCLRQTGILYNDSGNSATRSNCNLLVQDLVALTFCLRVDSNDRDKLEFRVITTSLGYYLLGTQRQNSTVNHMHKRSLT